MHESLFRGRVVWGGRGIGAVSSLQAWNRRARAGVLGQLKQMDDLHCAYIATALGGAVGFSIDVGHGIAGPWAMPAMGWCGVGGWPMRWWRSLPSRRVCHPRCIFSVFIIALPPSRHPAFHLSHSSRPASSSVFCSSSSTSSPRIPSSLGLV